MLRSHHDAVADVRFRQAGKDCREVDDELAVRVGDDRKV